MTTRMPRYDVLNDGMGPYAVFYCEKCDREFRSTPSVGGAIAKEVGRSALGGLLRNVPIVGSVADRALDDQRYTTSMTQAQLDAAWAQVESRFHECPICNMVCCPSCWDAQAETCNDDSPRSEEIAQAQAEQAAGVLKGIASVFGIDQAIKGAAEAAKAATANVARCSKCGKPQPPGARFCSECGGLVVQPAAVTRCPKCGAEVKGGKFCPECGARLEPEPTICPKCGADVKGGKFCPECGAKVGA